MAYTYLEFEKPISDLESKIENLKTSKEDNEGLEEISKISNQIESITKDIYDNLDIWQKVQVARLPHRPHFSNYIENILPNWHTDEKGQSKMYRYAEKIKLKSKNKDFD